MLPANKLLPSFAWNCLSIDWHKFSTLLLYSKRGVWDGDLVSSVTHIDGTFPMLHRRFVNESLVFLSIRFKLPHRSTFVTYRKYVTLSTISTFIITWMGHFFSRCDGRQITDVLLSVYYDCYCYIKLKQLIANAFGSSVCYVACTDSWCISGFFTDKRQTKRFYFLSVMWRICSVLHECVACPPKANQIFQSRAYRFHVHVDGYALTKWHLQSDLLHCIQCIVAISFFWLSFIRFICLFFIFFGVSYHRFSLYTPSPPLSLSISVSTIR